MDQMLVYYAIGRKTIKWYKRIFWRLFDMAIVNAFVLFTICHPEKITQKEFRLQLAEEPVKGHINERSSEVTTPGRKPKGKEKRLCGKHFSIGATKKGRCVVCGKKKKPNGKRRHKNSKLLSKVQRACLSW